MLGSLLLDVRARRLLRAVLAGVAGRTATLVAPLLATPAMLAHLGDADFGFWITGISITGIAAVADLGIANGLLTKVAAAYGGSQSDLIRRYLSSAYAALAVISAGIFLLGLACSWLSGWPTIVTIVLLTFILGMPGSIFYQFLYGIQQVPLVNALLVASASAAVVSCLIAIGMSAPPWLAVLSYGVPYVLVPYGGALFFFSRNRHFRPSLGSVRWEDCSSLLHLGAGFFVLSILTGIGMNADNVIIAMVTGPEAVAAYSIPMRLGSVLMAFVMTIFIPLWGANGEALARHEYAWVRRTTRTMSILGIALTVVGGGLLFYLSDSLIRLWVHRQFDGQQMILAASVLSSVVIAATSPYNMVLNALGRVNIQIWPWLIFVVVSISLKYFLLEDAALWRVSLITGMVYLITVCPTVILSVYGALAGREGAQTG